MLHRTLLAAAALAAGTLVLTMDAGPLFAEDIAREARLLSIDGEFEKIEKLLWDAPDEVKNDAKLRTQIAKNALKFIRKKEGEERRGGLKRRPVRAPSERRRRRRRQPRRPCACSPGPSGRNENDRPPLAGCDGRAGPKDPHLL